MLNSADYAYYIENQTDPALPRAEVYNYRPYFLHFSRPRIPVPERHPGIFG